MKTFWRYLKQHTWLMALPLLLMSAYGTTALAAQTPNFSATASGTTNNLTVSASLGIGDADAGKSGNNYLGFNFQQMWYFNNGTGWVPFAGGALPIYSSAALASQTIEVVRNADVSGLIGGQVYVGYGLTESDMLTNVKYGMVYTVAADTTAPTVSGTIHANGSTNVAINTAVGATFSEGMDPLTISNANFTLKETVSGAAVAGTVSYSGVNAVFTPSSNLANSTAYTATITTGAKDLAGNALAVNFVWSFTTAASAGPAVVNLGTAGNFAILTKAAITDVPASAITGNVGASPITAASILVMCTELAAGSKIYGVDAAYPTDPVCFNGLAADKIYVDTAVGDMGTAYSDAAGRTAGTGAFLNVGAGTLTDQTLVPGVYTFNGAGVTIPTNLTLAGGANDVWIFQISGTLEIATSKKVLLSGGALAKNIFWQVADAVTLQAGSHFEGTILAQKNIAMVTGATINGRLLAQTDVALDQNTVVKPAP